MGYLNHCYSGDYPTQVSGRMGMPLELRRTTYWSSEDKHSQQPTMSYHPTINPSSVHYLSDQY